jgi:hypothetical protein
MRKIDTYYFQSCDFERIKFLLEQRFDILFIPHDSYHYGDYCQYKITEGNEETFFMLRRNIKFEGELHFPQYAENTLILSVGSTARGDELKPIIESLGATHIGREQQ